ncbi:hypothetical protein JYB87_07280 [Shewanella avicenniae]|uniref:Nickel/cobalt transporter regulator n=1 Tax=Shewanella avicenniae TaxID=2814294 RepID=A0ABX7QU40_9GAMM|nr:hypothetical protein [Shewanella avicenniae]QSX35012.1 hypothetical protein JYB87_07280 [Shewanella avicenniae]
MTTRISHILAAISVATTLMLPSVSFAKNDHGELPPGLQKKAAKGKPLPPGWQKQYHRGDIIERDLYDRGRIVVPLDDKGLITVNIEGTLFKLNQKTREIIDILAR